MADKEKKEEEIPDELPSLAEDILKGDDKEEKKEDAAPAEEEVPDELPSLEDDEAPPEELPAEPEAAAEPAPTAVEEPATEVVVEENDESYFGGLIDKLRKNPRLSGDFLDEMKSYWRGHGGEKEEMVMKEGIKGSFELDLEKEMQEKVKQLKQLENSWKKQKLELERCKKLVENTEIEIQLRSEELKKIMDTLTELREVYHDIRRKLKARGTAKKAPTKKKPAKKRKH